MYLFLARLVLLCTFLPIHGKLCFIFLDFSQRRLKFFLKKATQLLLIILCVIKQSRNFIVCYPMLLMLSYHFGRQHARETTVSSPLSVLFLTSSLSLKKKSNNLITKRSLGPSLENITGEMELQLAGSVISTIYCE